MNGSLGGFLVHVSKKIKRKCFLIFFLFSDHALSNEDHTEPYTESHSTAELIEKE